LTSSLAFIFPGQGSQHAGMGAELLADREISGLCDSCAAAAGIDLRHLLDGADDDELRLTQNAQPALTFAGIALARLLGRRGVVPDAVAGHSVGEYTALAVAGAISPEAAMRAVVARGRAMAEAAPPGTSTMAAALGLAPDAVVTALEPIDDVWPANFNTPTQTVIAGTIDGVERGTARLEQAGARRVLPLNVSAAFHTPLMAPAARALRAALDELDWHEPALPVISNVDAHEYPGAREAPELLERQLRSPVRWADCVARLVAVGCSRFVEVGPKRVLTGMMRELAPRAWTAAVATPTACEALAVP
jgi:[acyl-carrier-protein] S-malonyltransferase